MLHGTQKEEEQASKEGSAFDSEHVEFEVLVGHLNRAD